MKKTLAILLALALVFSSVTVAFAEEALPADAAAVKGLGMLVGAGNGVTVDYLKVAPTRIQAAIMVLRLKGLEDAAKAFTGTDNFADANTAAWAAPIMAYLKANPQLGWIGNAGSFNPNGEMDAKSYYKVMLETLGYKQNTNEVIGDFTYANTLEFAASKGLKNVASVLSFTVNDLATATVETLKATVKGSEKSLAASLVDAKVISMDKAVAAGVYTVAPVVLAVQSVNATNLKETVVTFNKEVNEKSAETKGNYKLDDEAIAGTVELNADKKSVTITWDASLDNQTEYDLTVSDVLDAAGVEIDEVTVTFLANDVTLPVAQSLTLVGPNKLKLVFSEPINEDVLLVDDYSITVEDEDFDYEVSGWTVEGNEVTIELSDDELEVGTYSVEISDFRDYANLKNLKKTFALVYAKDTTAPVATVKEATQTKVVVEFNKPVYNGEAGNAQPLTVDFFYHTYTSFKPGAVKTTNDQKFTLYFDKDEAVDAGLTWATDNGEEFDERPLPEGAVKFVIVADAKDDITDGWGNELANNISFNLTISADTTAPMVTDIEVEEDQKTIKIYFSEDIKTVDEDNFTIVNEDGEDVPFSYVTYYPNTNDDDEYYVTLKLDEVFNGELSITIEDVVDKALEENEIAKITKKVTVKDQIAPNFETDTTTIIGVNKNLATEKDYIYVTFEDDMATSGTYSVLNKDNYQLLRNNVYYDLGKDDKIATFGGNDKIKITLDDASLFDVAGDGGVGLAADVYLVIGRVADALGNKAEVFGLTNMLVAKETSPIITAVKTIAEKTIEITINGELKAVNKSYITVVNGAASGDLYSIKSWSVDDGKTVITGILPSSLKLSDSAYTDITVMLADKKFETISGTKVDAFTFAKAGVKDGYAPTIAKVSSKYKIAKTAEKTFTIEFDENLDNSVDYLFAQDLVVKNSKGDVLVAGVDYTTTSLNKVITVVIENTSKAKVGNYKVYSNDTIKYIRDLNKTKANAFTSSFTVEDLVLVPQP
ncbi:MAG: hypothetical protein A2Y23_05225 [Clostridiales bacterium GWB2_37_7]|nr:MAG: hypothetical protein A2Y23_05225 [Clostridiales bacterium GWB2_37_7]